MIRLVKAFCLLAALLAVSALVAQPDVQQIEAELSQLNLPDSQRLGLLLDLSNAYVEADLEKMKNALTEAEPLAEKLNDDFSRATIKLNMGIYYDGKFKVEESLQSYLAAIEYYQKATYPRGVADAKLNIALLAKQLGDFQQAVSLLNEATETYIQLKDTLSLGFVKLNLASVYSIRQDYRFAQQMAQEALTFAVKAHDSIGIVYAMEALANCYYDQKQYNRVIEGAREIIPLVDILNLNALRPFPYRSVGLSYLRLGKLDSAALYLEQSLAFARKSAYAESLSSSLSAVARLYKEQGRYADAFKLALENYKLTDSLRMPDAKRRVCYELHEIESERKQFQSANQYLLEAYSLKDTLLNREKIQQMEQGKFQSSLLVYQETQKALTLELTQQSAQLKQQRKIAVIVTVALALVLALLLGLIIYQKRTARLLKLVSHQHKQLNQANLELVTLHEEMKAYSHALIHDLKTPLNSVLSIAYLQEQQSESADPTTTALLRQAAHQGLALINAIMELLQVESLQVKQESIVTEKLFEELSAQFTPLAGKKSIALHFHAGVEHFIADAFLVKRCLHNLISNAIKFSTAQKNIWVSVQEHAGKLEMIVKDEGPGFSDVDKQNLFKRFNKLSAKPTGGEVSHGLGLVTVKTMVDKMGGSIRLDSMPMQGATFTLELPQSIPW